MGDRLEVGVAGWGVCTEFIQGVVISAFHFAFQLERSRFQIHPHTGTAREESAGEGGSSSRGMGQHGQGWRPWHGHWEPWQIGLRMVHALYPRAGDASALDLKAVQVLGCPVSTWLL